MRALAYARSIAALIGVVITVLCASVACAQNYPNKPVRIIASEVGGPGDFTSRIVAQGLTGALGEPVIVENRPTANIALEIVAKAEPDGYTLVTNNNPMWYTPFMRKTSYDPVKDFLPITLMTSAPAVLVVHPSLSAKSVAEMIALAKAKPGTLNFATGSAGSSARLAGELLKAKAGVNIVLVPYKGTGPAITSLLSGQEVQLMFSPPTGAAPQIKAGRLRALAVTSAKTSALFPELPTMAATLPGFELVSVVGMFAPARTPAALITRLNREIVRVLTQPDVKSKFFEVGVEVIGSSPEQFAAAIKSDMAVMGKVITDAGIRAE